MNTNPMTEPNRTLSSVVEGPLPFVETLSQKPKKERPSHISRERGESKICVEKVWTVLKYGKTTWDG